MNEKNTNKEDLRIRRTYKLLKAALLELLKKEPFEKITVKDICEEAMVHRTTFYTHFEDKYDLLRYCMQELESPFETIDIKTPSVEGYKEYYSRVAKSILEHVYKNKDFYKTVIRKNSEESFITNFEKELSIKIHDKLEMCQKSGLKLPMPAELLSCVCSSACMSAVKWWIENDAPFSIDQLLKYIDLNVVF